MLLRQSGLRDKVEDSLSLPEIMTVTQENQNSFLKCIQFIQFESYSLWYLLFFYIVPYYLRHLYVVLELHDF